MGSGLTHYTGSVYLRLNEGSREMEEIEQSSMEDLGLSSEQMKNSSEV